MVIHNIYIPPSDISIINEIMKQDNHFFIS